MADVVKLRGIKEVEEALTRLGPVAGPKVIRQAEFHATKPILNEARSHVERIENGSGALHLSLGRSFEARSRVEQEGGRFVMHVGPRKKNRRAVALYNLFYGRRVRGIFHGHLVEFGHRVARRAAAKAQSIGKVAAQPFLRPALASKGAQAISIFATQIGKRVERALKKQNAAADNV